MYQDDSVCQCDIERHFVDNTVAVRWATGRTRGRCTQCLLHIHVVGELTHEFDALREKWTKKGDVGGLDEHPLYHAFLRWLVDEECYDAHQVLAVVEKPRNWRKEFEEFIPWWVNDWHGQFKGPDAYREGFIEAADVPPRTTPETGATYLEGVRDGALARERADIEQGVEPHESV